MIYCQNEYSTLCLSTLRFSAFSSHCANLSHPFQALYVNVHSVESSFPEICVLYWFHLELVPWLTL